MVSHQSSYSLSTDPRTITSWKRRLRLLCCCCCVQPDSYANPHYKDVFTNVAKVFAEFFGGVDLVPSDVVVGLILVRKQHQRKRRCVIKQLNLSGPNIITSTTSSSSSSSSDPSQLNPESDPFSPPSSLQSSNNLHEKTKKNSSEPLFYSTFPAPNTYPPVTWKDLYPILHYYKYATAIYGLPLYLFSKPYCGLLPYCCPRCFSSPVLSDDPIDLIAQHNTFLNGPSPIPTALTSSSNLNDHHSLSSPVIHQDIVHVSWRNELFHSPYLICIDSKEETIVVAVRGTLSLNDALIDLNIDLEVLGEGARVMGGNRNWKAHGGIYRTAKKIWEDIRWNSKLDQALIDRPHYNVKIVGHSLGGVSISKKDIIYIFVRCLWGSFFSIYISF